MNLSADDLPSNVSGGGVSWTMVRRSCMHTCASVWVGFNSSGGAAEHKAAAIEIAKKIIPQLSS